MREISKTWYQMTFQDIPNAIFSQELADGVSRFEKQGGKMIDLSGQDRAHVSLSVQPENKKDCQMTGTYGRSGSNLLNSADLSRFLANKLKQQLDMDGLILFAMTWKTKDTPSGRSVCLLRASARRISGNVCGSWPTPSTRDHKGGYQGGRMRNGKLSTDVLDVTAQLTHWPTPQAIDGNGKGREGRLKKDGRRNPNAPGSYRMDLKDTVLLSGWATPRANDSEKRGEISNDKRSGIPAQALHTSTRINRFGRELTGFIVEMENGGQLNPELSRWIMGYPAEWAHCQPTAMPSSRKSRRNS